MADFNFEHMLIKPTRDRVDRYGYPVLQESTLADISFSINHELEEPSQRFDLPMDCEIFRGLKYYDEEQNVWYYRWDGVVHMGPIAKIMPEKDYPMSILMPLDWLNDDK